MVCLLLLAVLVPTGCVLYFMNEAIGRERDAAARSISEAYGIQLRGVADNIDALWQRRSADLERVSESDSPAAWFERAVTGGLADAVICLAPDGTPLYPALPQAPAPDPTEHAPEWIAAREQERAGKFEAASQAYSAIAAKQHRGTGKGARSPGHDPVSGTSGSGGMPRSTPSSATSKPAVCCALPICRAA